MPSYENFQIWRLRLTLTMGRDYGRRGGVGVKRDDARWPSFLRVRAVIVAGSKTAMPYLLFNNGNCTKSRIALFFSILSLSKVSATAWPLWLFDNERLSLYDEDNRPFWLFDNDSLLIFGEDAQNNLITVKETILKISL